MCCSHIILIIIFFKSHFGRAAAKKKREKVFLIEADRLAKQCSNYNLISRQRAESSIPFNINNLTLYKNPLRIDFKGSNRCCGGGG